MDWRVGPRLVDEFISPGVKDPATATTVTFAQGLSNTRHSLDIFGDKSTPVTAIRVYGRGHMLDAY